MGSSRKSAADSGPCLFRSRSLFRANLQGRAILRSEVSRRRLLPSLGGLVSTHRARSPAMCSKSRGELEADWGGHTCPRQINVRSFVYLSRRHLRLRFKSSVFLLFSATSGDTDLPFAA